jgi:hypothetical protein
LLFLHPHNIGSALSIAPQFPKFLSGPSHERKVENPYNPVALGFIEMIVVVQPSPDNRIQRHGQILNVVPDQPPQIPAVDHIANPLDGFVTDGR